MPPPSAKVFGGGSQDRLFHGFDDFCTSLHSLSNERDPLLLNIFLTIPTSPFNPPADIIHFFPSPPLMLLFVFARDPKASVPLLCWAPRLCPPCEFPVTQRSFFPRGPILLNFGLVSPFLKGGRRFLMMRRDSLFRSAVWPSLFVCWFVFLPRISEPPLTYPPSGGVPQNPQKSVFFRYLFWGLIRGPWPPFVHLPKKADFFFFFFFC